MRALCLALFCLCLTPALGPQVLAAEPAKVTGTITLAEPATLSPEAIVSVRLMDVTDDAEEPGDAGGDDVKLGPGSFPYAFAIAPYEEALIRGHTYAVSAWISGEVGMIWQTPLAVPVDPFAGQPVTIALELVPFSAFEYGSWTFPAGNNDLGPRVKFALEPGAVRAWAGCKVFTATSAASGSALSFSRLQVAGRDCGPDMQALEERARAVLDRTRSWAMTETALVVFDAAGAAIERLIPQ